MNRKVLKIIGVVGLTGLGVLSQNNCTFAYTTDSITDWSEVVVDPSVGIDMNQPIVGANDLDQVEGLPSSASFYKPVGINVKDVKSYYISVSLDCSAITDPTNKAKCESGNLLTSSGETLKSVDSAKTFSTMSNEWGFRYNIGDSVSDPRDKYFAPLPTTKSSGYIQLDGEERIKTGATYSDNKTLTLGFGAKVNGDTAAGTYNGKVTVAVVASPSDPTIANLTYMQQMTSDICSNTPEGEYALQDTRDEKIYKVAKMKDDNCWMIQNLALDSGETEEARRELNSDSSDLADGTTYVMPISGSISSVVFNDTNGMENPLMFGGTHQDDTYDTGGCKTMVSCAYDFDDNTGGYYNWLTAIAESARNTQKSGEKENSICPKGWQLPSGGNDGQFMALYAAYGGTLDTIGINTVVDVKDFFDSAWHPGYGGRAIRNGAGGGSFLSSTGGNEQTSFWLSRTVYSQTGMYLFQERDQDQRVVPTDYNSYHFGFSVRCVVR